MPKNPQQTTLLFAFTALVVGGVSLYLVLSTILSLKDQPSANDLGEILTVWFWPLISLAGFTILLIWALIFQMKGQAQPSQDQSQQS